MPEIRFGTNSRLWAGARAIRRWLAAALVLSLLASPALAGCRQDEAADALAATALNSQQQGELEFAEKTWLRLLNEHPGFKRRAEARHNLGICQARLKKHAEAIESFGKAIAELPKSSTETLAGAHLFLGYSQLELGRELAASDPQKSNQLLTTATVTLEKIRRTWPEYKGLHEALWNQGNAFEELDRLDEARKAYAEVAANKDSSWRRDAIYALGWIEQREGNHTAAAGHYREWLAESSEADGDVASEVRLRAAESIWQLAVAAAARSDGEARKKLAGESAALLEGLVDQRGFAERDQAIFLAAVQAGAGGDPARSAELFAQASELDDTTLRDKALLNAGLQYVAAQRPELAEAEFRKLIEADSELSAQAAHEQARLLRGAGQHEAAAKLAAAWAAKTADQRLKAELLFDEAEATLPLDEDRARQLYLRIADGFPDTPAAPLALYNAAWGAAQAKDAKLANQLIARFEEDYSGHSYLPDVRELKAELLAASDGPAAARLLKDLAEQHPEHPRMAHWLVALAAEQLRAGQTAESIATARRVAGNQELSGPLRAQAMYWTALAEHAAGDSGKARAALDESLAISADWNRADEVFATLADWQAAAGDWSGAEATLARLQKDFPESVAVAGAAVRVAGKAFDAGDFGRAKAWFGLVHRQFAASPFAVTALNGLAWSELKLGQSAAAAQLFRTIVEEHGGHELAKEAARGLAAALRAGGNHEAAIVALREQIQALDPATDSSGLRYELVLALVAAEQHPAVVTEARELLKLDAAKLIADRVRYELAWALLSDGQSEAALGEFRTIVRDHPASPVAADASFQLGEVDYRAGEFASAEEHYRRAFGNESAPANIRERAAYKLGWSLYRQKEFAAAHEQFTTQVRDFPDGDFLADGLFMIGESLFAQDKFAEAASALGDSRKTIETSQRIQPANRWLAWLHGSQAAFKAGQHEQALEFARLLADDESADAALREDAWLEVGNAYRELGDLDAAEKAWTRAAANLGKTGARAWCLLGDRLFVAKKFDEAIDIYKNVYLGYGGDAKDPAIDAWQAYALYEAALCYTVQVDTAPAELRADLIGNATRLFEKLIAVYPDDSNVAEARKNLDKLKRRAAAGPTGT